MIPWYWIPVIFLVGCLFGVFITALMMAYGNNDHRGE